MEDQTRQMTRVRPCTDNNDASIAQRIGRLRLFCLDPLVLLLPKLNYLGFQSLDFERTY